MDGLLLQMIMIYTRVNSNVFFLLPAFAVGIDLDGRYFFEIAWLVFAIGLGTW